ncbi:MAG: FHA domain-containing protein [Symploca sp. SIO3C6]|uniref:Ferredoxin--NADP reductase n=1 Tax=Symploca sp. SIO1C4 TaxID=2607765 RepID=A0A6B3NE85_9CYAN|nr:FHA domain-containing protein [Symploca sp. SIO3C6]NER29225.1 FHA domain-containing protein [Symploca sp. SIO1C4]
MIKIKALNSQTGEFQEKVLATDDLTTGEWLIGRHPSCDLILNCPYVSRIHGRIILKQRQFYFTDLGSADGSQINDQVVEINQGYILKPCDMIRIGACIVTITPASCNMDETKLQPLDKQVAWVVSNQPKQWIKGKITLRCLRVIAETNDVKTFVFGAEPAVLFNYKPGQFVTLELPINGQTIKRPYSISSTPSRPHTLEITVKRVPTPAEFPDALPGVVSNWLHDNITVGCEIKLSGPMGKFTCMANPSQKLLLISAGVGITPMISMSRWIYDKGADTDVVFFHSARTPGDIIFRCELELMAARKPNFKLAVTTTGAAQASAWLGYRGRFNRSMLQGIAPDFQERTVYVCGPDKFMQEVKSMLEELQFPMENYHQESFGTSKKVKKMPTTAAESVSNGNKLAPTEIFLPRIESNIPRQIAFVGSSVVSHQLGNYTSTLLKEVEQDSTPSSLATSRRQLHSTISAHREITSPAQATSKTIIKDNLTPSVDVVSPPATTSTVISSPPVVVFAKSGKEVAFNDEDSILEVAQQEGIELPCACQMGACGTCKQPLLEGKVTYDGQDPECEPGYVLTCIAKPEGRVVIDA